MDEKMDIPERNRRLEELDRRLIWHPFTQMKDWESETPLIIEEGRGHFLRDIYGRWYLDGVSSLWVNVHGHRKREIDDAIREQLDRISHTTLLGLGNVPSIRLAERLIHLVNSSLATSDSLLNRVFYSDNGSTSVEVALKMAFQYWMHRGVRGKNAFISLKNAYHGDTLGAVSVGGIDIFHKAFRPLLFKTFMTCSPYCYRCELGLRYPSCGLGCLERLEEILKKHSSGIAALIIEPMVQGAGGMIVFPPGYLRGAWELARKYNILFIADEVATGFGRTGRMFACEHEEAVPDLLCISKGLTGGYLPLAATITTEEIYSAFLGEYAQMKTFFHGHSYTGNPLACAAAVASLELFEKEALLESMGEKGDIFTEWLNDLRGLRHVGDARGMGLMGGVELVRGKEGGVPYKAEEKTGYRVCLLARKRGLLIRPLGDVVVIMPPISISKADLRRVLHIIRESIEEVTEDI